MLLECCCSVGGGYGLWTSWDFVDCLGIDVEFLGFALGGCYVD